jgi:hypothetical protein
MAVHERRYQHDKVSREQTFVKLFREDRGNGAVRIGKHLEKRRVSEVYVQTYTALGTTFKQVATSVHLSGMVGTACLLLQHADSWQIA